MKNKFAFIFAATFLSTAVIAENLMKYLPPEVLDDPDNLEHAARIAQEEGFGKDTAPLFERAAFLRKKTQEEHKARQELMEKQRQTRREQQIQESTSELQDNLIIHELLGPSW